MSTGISTTKQNSSSGIQGRSAPFARINMKTRRIKRPLATRILAAAMSSRPTNLRLAQLGALGLLMMQTLLACNSGAHSMELHRRVKRALYDLPAGSEEILGAPPRTTFTCDGLGYGYYADQDNECKIFHICQSFKMSDGSIYNNHWSFMCANQTVFNQVTLACSHPEDAIPCESSRDFYHVNDYFGDALAPSVKESDLDSAQDLIVRSYGSRLSAGSA